MDPNACVERIYLAVCAGAETADYQEVSDAAGDLQDWLARGGFAPDAFHVHVLTVAIGMLARDAMRNR